jgi:glycosyltransferase involved in cell wall biosynthesis
MRLLCLSTTFPLPPDSGEAHRVLGFVRALASRHETHLLVLRRTSTTDAEVRSLGEILGCAVEAFLPPDSYSQTLAGRVRRWAGACRRATPPWLEARWDAELAERARQLAPACDATVLLDKGVYASSVASPRVILDKTNVLGWSVLDRPRVFRSRDYARWALTIPLIRSYERRTLALADTIIVTTKEERLRLKRLYGRVADSVIPTAVDPGPMSTRADPQAIGWLGALDYAPNRDGLLRFVKEAWGCLAAQGYRLLIAGRSDSPEIANLERHKGIQLLGYVENLTAFLNRISAAVVPLWAGAGIKVKTLTLMGAGVPVVSTHQGLEGVVVQPGRHYVAGEDPASLAKGLRSILSNRAYAEAVAREGRQLILDRYSWRVVGMQIRSTVEGPPLHSREGGHSVAHSRS